MVKDLISTMASRKKAWLPDELCEALGIDIAELAQLIKKARKQGYQLYRSNDERVGNTNKIWLRV